MDHSTTRATILPVIIKYIMDEYKLEESEALTGAAFADDETGLYGQSPLFIFGLYMTEINEIKQSYIT